MLTKKEQRLRRARQTRIRIATHGVVRLTVNRTNLHIYASLISPEGGKVLATASTLEAEVRQVLTGSGAGVAAAREGCGGSSGRSVVPAPGPRRPGQAGWSTSSSNSIRPNA